MIHQTSKHTSQKQRFQKIRLLGPFLSFMVLIGPATADAYNLYSFKWPQPSTAFYVNIPGSDGRWNDAFEAAMYSWHVGTNFNFLIYRNQYEDPCDAINSRNGVAFGITHCGQAWGATTLAVTQFWFYDSTSTTIQTDIVFNGTKEWAVYSTPWQSSPFNGKNDFKRVAIHELGHALGLMHEDSGIPSIMKSYVGNTVIPQQDDINGVIALYGFPVTDADGDGVSDSTDNCPTSANANQVDSDVDSVGDACDACPWDSLKVLPGMCGCNVSEVLTDTNGNGVLDCIEIDSDGDGFSDAREKACGSDPADPNSKCKTSLPPILMLLLGK